MKTYLLFSAILLLAACEQAGQDNSTVTHPTPLLPADTVPALRENISPKPVAQFSEPIRDQLNNWKFAVTLYETKKTFQYNLQVQAKEVRVNDSIRFPNLGFAPTPAIEKGKEPFTCIIGFLDPQGNFKEYKKVSFANDQLRIKTSKTYYVGYVKPQ